MRALAGVKIMFYLLIGVWLRQAYTSVSAFPGM